MRLPQAQGGLLHGRALISVGTPVTRPAERPQSTSCQPRFEGGPRQGPAAARPPGSLTAEGAWVGLEALECGANEL